MYVVCVNVLVKPGMGEAYMDAIAKNHAGALLEPGCLRFDVLRQATPPADGEGERFFFYEVYRTEADFAVHQKTAHYLTFRDIAEPLQAEPRAGVRYRSVLPEPYA